MEIIKSYEQILRTVYFVIKENKLNQATEHFSYKGICVHLYLLNVCLVCFEKILQKKICSKKNIIL